MLFIFSCVFLKITKNVSFKSIINITYHVIHSIFENQFPTNSIFFESIHGKNSEKVVIIIQININL